MKTVKNKTAPREASQQNIHFKIYIHINKQISFKPTSLFPIFFILFCVQKSNVFALVNCDNFQYQNNFPQGLKQNCIDQTKYKRFSIMFQQLFPSKAVLIIAKSYLHHQSEEYKIHIAKQNFAVKKSQHTPAPCPIYTCQFVISSNCEGYLLPSINSCSVYLSEIDSIDHASI